MQWNLDILIFVVVDKLKATSKKIHKQTNKQIINSLHIMKEEPLKGSPEENGGQTTKTEVLLVFSEINFPGISHLFIHTISIVHSGKAWQLKGLSKLLTCKASFRAYMISLVSRRPRWNM